MVHILNKEEYKIRDAIKYYIRYIKDDGTKLDSYLRNKTGKKDPYKLMPSVLNKYIAQYISEVDNNLELVLLFARRAKCEYGLYFTTLYLFVDINEVDIIDYYNYEEVFGGDIAKALKDLLCNLDYNRLQGGLDNKELENMLFKFTKQYNSKEKLDEWIETQKHIVDLRRNEDK